MKGRHTETFRRRLRGPGVRILLAPALSPLRTSFSGGKRVKIRLDLDDIPHPERSLSFWHYNTSKRGITLNLGAAHGRRLFGRLTATSDVILETFRPGFLASLELDYQSLHKENPRLIMCSLTPFGQTGPWRDYLSSDLLHMAAGGEMASSGYDEADAPNAPPIAPGGGNAWHMGCHFAVMAALVHRMVSGQGQYIDASIHEACALTTEAAIANYIYRGEVVRRQTGRHHAAGPTPRTQFRAKDGTYVCALVDRHSFGGAMVAGGVQCVSKTL